MQQERTAPNQKESSLKTFSLTENQFSGKTYFYTIASRRIPEKGWDRNRVIEEVNKMMQLGENK